jgi:hypothetical protein
MVSSTAVNQVNYGDSTLTGFGIYRPFTDGTRVYLTLPGGDREGFTFMPQAVTDLFTGTSYHPSFVADHGVVDQLSVPDVTLMQLDDGSYATIESSGLNSYNPADPV